MADPTRAPKGEVQLGLRWGDANELEQVLADELQIQSVNNRFYLTFGQILVPVVEPKEGQVVEIRPVGRFVVSKTSLEKIRNLLERVLDREKGQ